jgi:transcription elongation factor GreA
MTETTPSTVVWLTQAKYDELKAELEQLRGPRRAELVKRVSDARDEGDLKENAGYHAARDELGKLDGRAQQLTDMLERAKVGETPADDGIVEPGMKVTVKLVGIELDPETFLFGAREMASDDIKVYSPQSPLGQAINGAQRGDTRTYELPNGKKQDVEILEAVPYAG